MWDLRSRHARLKTRWHGGGSRGIGGSSRRRITHDGRDEELEEGKLQCPCTSWKVGPSSQDVVGIGVQHHPAKAWNVHSPAGSLGGSPPSTDETGGRGQLVAKTSEPGPLDKSKPSAVEETAVDGETTPNSLSELLAVWSEDIKDEAR